MSVSPLRASSPPLSPLRGQPSRIQDIRSKIIRSNVELKQPLSPLKKANALRYSDRVIPPFSPIGKVTSNSTVPESPDLRSSTMSATHSTTSSLPDPEIDWTHPDLAKIEHRMVNKELEIKRVLINFILLLVSRLGFNFAKLLLLKLEIGFNMEDHSKYLYLFQILFLWNIAGGLFKVMKPQDDFKDLDLTPHQRELLGLTPIPLKTNTASVSYRSATKSTTAEEKTKVTSRTTTSTLSTTTNDPSVKEKRIKAPIASPMSSTPMKKLSTKTAVAKKSPLKFDSTTITTSNARLKTSDASLNTNPLLAKLKEAAAVSTPTYIPSPKYYYRMDSPTKARRRV